MTTSQSTLKASSLIAADFAAYKELSKSGIVTLVVISVLGGYLIGHPSEVAFNWSQMILTLFGVLFLASGSSALNQIQERHVDAEMPRTANRPLPSGRLSPTGASFFVIVTLVMGLGLLLQISVTELVLGVLAVVSYNGLYTLWWKKRWAHAAVPGAIPGALPILMGHAAANGNVWNPAGVYLFFILFFWQMPHFWVLALRYKKDYELGRFPTLPVALGDGITVLQISVWCLAYVGIALMAPLFMPVGPIYLALALPTCVKVLWELRRVVIRRESDQGAKSWLPFFLWVNFSLIGFIFAAAIDLWHPQLMTPFWTR